MYVEMLNEYLEMRKNGQSPGTVDPGIAEYDRMVRMMGDG